MYVLIFLKQAGTTPTIPLLWKGMMIFLLTSWYLILIARMINTSNYDDVCTAVADTVAVSGLVVFIFSTRGALFHCRYPLVNFPLGSRHLWLLSLSVTMTSFLLQYGRGSISLTSVMREGFTLLMVFTQWQRLIVAEVQMAVQARRMMHWIVVFILVLNGRQWSSNRIWWIPVSLECQTEAKPCVFTVVFSPQIWRLDPCLV